jgi:membrane protein YqaA with SNARE-associated domain
VHASGESCLPYLGDCSAREKLTGRIWPFERAFMDKYHLPIWLQTAVAASGGLGLFLMAFLDSSFLPLPTVNDLLLINLCIQFPLRMPFYAAAVTVGSVAGCLVLYFIGRKTEEAAYHHKGGIHAARVRNWVQKNGFISVLIAALLPPPMPFKLFVLAAGVLGMPLRTFVVAITIARAVRFYGEGYLAMRYGVQAANYLIAHRVGFALGSLFTVAGCYAIYRLVSRRPQQEA